MGGGEKERKRVGIRKRTREEESGRKEERRREAGREKERGRGERIYCEVYFYWDMALANGSAI